MWHATMICPSLDYKCQLVLFIHISHISYIYRYFMKLLINQSINQSVLGPGPCESTQAQCKRKSEPREQTLPAEGDSKAWLKAAEKVNKLIFRGRILIQDWTLLCVSGTAVDSRLSSKAQPQQLHSRMMTCPCLSQPHIKRTLFIMAGSLNHRAADLLTLSCPPV